MCLLLSTGGGGGIPSDEHRYDIHIYDYTSINMQINHCRKINSSLQIVMIIKLFSNFHSSISIMKFNLDNH